MAKKFTKQEIQEKLDVISNKRYTLIGEYINSKTKIKTLCSKCNKTWDTNVGTLLKGFGCPNCSGTAKKNTETIKEEVFDLVGDEYTVLGEYVNTHTKILFRHNTCGNEFLMSPKAFIHDGQRCPKERYIKSAETNSKIQGKSKEKNIEIQNICNNEGYEILESYTRSKKTLSLKHIECGNIFNPLPYDFLKGTRCPYCCRSKGENIIKEFLEKNNFSFREQYKIDGCKNKRRLSFDFAILDGDKVKVLIEYDGSQHFNPKFGMSSESKKFNNINKNDEIKNVFCRENNIPLIRIKYFRSRNDNSLKEKIINKLKEELAINNILIPSQA